MSMLVWILLPVSTDCIRVISKNVECTKQARSLAHTTTHFVYPTLFVSFAVAEFLERTAMKGEIISLETGKVSFPPQKNRTQWDGASEREISELYLWLRKTARMVDWDPEKCMAVFPKSSDPANIEELRQIKKEVDKEKGGFPPPDKYVGNPTPVDGSVKARLKENFAQRESLCIYDQELQAAPLIHFGFESRLLVHFYAFMFFQDWKEDLWMKRFVRDHVRYIDEIQCAAARVVTAIREHARKRDPKHNPNGDFDTFHIRRGDFQYTVTRFDAKEILEMSQRKLKPNSTVYMYVFTSICHSHTQKVDI
jgi:hypothetical protein